MYMYRNPDHTQPIASMTASAGPPHFTTLRSLGCDLIAKLYGIAIEAVIEPVNRS